MMMKVEHFLEMKNKQNLFTSFCLYIQKLSPSDGNQKCLHLLLQQRPLQSILQITVSSAKAMLGQMRFEGITYKNQANRILVQLSGIIDQAHSLNSRQVQSNPEYMTPRLYNAVAVNQLSSVNFAAVLQLRYW